MASRIQQIIPASGWFAVFARPSGTTREHPSHSAPRSSVAGGMYRTGAPIPEFLPLVAWALVLDDADNQAASRIVGVVIDEDQQAKAVLSPDDPSFLGYAGPGDPGIDRVGRTPDWRARAKQAIAELKQV
jgi:hypothetical protein